MGWFKRTFRGESKKSPNSRIKYCVPLFVMKPMDDDAGYFYADGQSISSPAILSTALIARLELPFLLTLLLRYDHDTQKQECDSQNGHSGPKREREFFKEICGQADGYNGFPEIGYHSADELSTFIADDNHRVNDNMVGNICQIQFSPA